MVLTTNNLYNNIYICEFNNGLIVKRENHMQDRKKLDREVLKKIAGGAKKK
jgi:hypothetical protein